MLEQAVVEALAQVLDADIVTAAVQRALAQLQATHREQAGRRRLLERDIEAIRACEQRLAEAVRAKAAATTPPASRQIQDPTRARTGVAASKVFEYQGGRISGFVETKDDGERVRQVFERDAAGRISKIVTLKAGELSASEQVAKAAEKARHDDELVVRHIFKHRGALTAKGMSWFDIMRALR